MLTTQQTWQCFFISAPSINSNFTYVNCSELTIWISIRNFFPFFFSSNFIAIIYLNVCNWLEKGNVLCYIFLNIFLFLLKMFHVDSRKGKTYLAFGNDSSCTENLYNATSGLETLILTKNTNTKQMPNYVKTHLSE